MLRPLSGGNMAQGGGLSSMGMNMNMHPNAATSGGGNNNNMANMGSGSGGISMAMPMAMNMTGVGNVGSNMTGMTSRLVSPRHAVHIIWDIEHVGVPSGASEVWVINSLVALAERECQGYVESFVACCHEGYLDLKTKRELQDSGVAVEEVHARRPTDNYILTRLLALSLQLSLHRSSQSSSSTSSPSLLQLAGNASSSYNSSGVARPILIMITGERDLARALHIIRQSSIFQEIVLLHPPMHDSGEVLRQAATQAVEWLSFLSLNQMALQQQQQGGGRLTPMANMGSPMIPTPPGIATRSRAPLPPGGPSSGTNTPETRYRGMSADQSSLSPPILTPSGGSNNIDENRPMGGRGDWQAWQDKSDKVRAQQQPSSSSSSLVSTPTMRTKSESDNWRTPSTPSTGGSNSDLPPPPYRTPYQREMARRLHPASAASSSGSPGSSPLASPPSPGDVRVSDERDRDRDNNDPYYDQHHRVTTAADYLREKEAAAWEHQQGGAGGRSRSSSTASVGGRLISLDEQHSQHSGSSSGGHSTPTSGSGTPSSQASYAQVLGKGGNTSTSSNNTPIITATITPRAGSSGSGSSSAPGTPVTTSARTPTLSAAGSSTPGASTRARPDRATLAIRLFSHVMNVCAEEKIIPRESVIRSKLEDTSVWDSTKKDQQQAPPGLKSWQSLHMEFETWLDMVQNKKACVCVGVSPQRVLWPCPPQARFECADYFRPQERLNAGEMTQLVEFLANDQHRSGSEHTSQHHQGGGQVDRGRYGFANYLKSSGPQFVRDMPRGYVVELVQLLLNKNFLQFRKGKVSFRSTAAGRWKRALESVHASGIGGTPSLDDVGNDHHDEDDCNPASMDEHDALTRSSSSSSSSSRSSAAMVPSNNSSGSGIGSNSESVLITSTRPGTKSTSTSVVSSNSSTSGGSNKGSISPYPPARAPSSSPDSSSESSSQAIRRASMIAQRSTTGSSPMMEAGRPRAATMPMASDAKSSGKLIARGTTPPASGGAAPVGPSLDFDDPVELLAVKCVEAPSPILSSSTMALILARERLAADARQSFYPLYHFEKSGEQHAPLWVCVITLDLRYPMGRMPIGTIATSSLAVPTPVGISPISNAVAQRPKRFRSTRKAKKLEAQQEAAMRAIESGYWTEAFQPPVAEGGKPVTPAVRDYVANIIDDAVVILDRLLITLEQAPAVYSMESAISQHGSGSRTMWTCGVQLALRPRPAHLTTGTISVEQAENGEMPTSTSDDVASVRYPTIKYTASQAKKFDAKGQVASHVLSVLDKSRHRYPMLFQATPEPLPPRPKTLLMPTMIGTNSAHTSSISGSSSSNTPSASGSGSNTSAPAPSSASRASTVSQPAASSSSVMTPQATPKSLSPTVLPQRTPRDHRSTIISSGSSSSSGSASSTPSSNDSASGSSAAATYHAAQARAHKLLLEQQAQQQHQQQQMLQQQQAQQYGMGSGGSGGMGSPVITMMPHPPPIPPSYMVVPISSPPYGTSGSGSNISGTSGRGQSLRATANEWQPASSSSVGTGSSTGSLPSEPSSSASLSSSMASPSSSSSAASTSGSSSPSVSPPSGTFTDRLQRIPMIRTFLSNLTSPSSSAPSGGRYLTPSHVVASEHSGVAASSSSSQSSSSSSLGSSSMAQGGQVPGMINVNKSPSGSPLSGLRAITPPGQNLRAYVSPMGRTRPVSESALGLGGIQWEHQSQSPIPIGGTGKDSSSTSGSGSNSARMVARRLNDDDGMRSLRRSIDDARQDQSNSDNTNNNSSSSSGSGMIMASNTMNDSGNKNDANNDNGSNKPGNDNDGGKNTNDSNSNTMMAKPTSSNNINTSNSNDKRMEKSDTGTMATNVDNNAAGNAKNNKNESRALMIPSPVHTESSMITSPSVTVSSLGNSNTPLSPLLSGSESSRSSPRGGQPCNAM